MVKTITKPGFSDGFFEYTVRHDRILASGEHDGFKWYVGCFDLPSVGIFQAKPTVPVYVAYIDVTGTKLDGICNLESLTSLNIKFHNNCCTFASSAENSSILRTIGISHDRWMIGEDYLDKYYLLSSSSDEDLIFNEHEMAKSISRRLEEETIPSLIKVLVLLDLKGEVILDSQIAAS